MPSAKGPEDYPLHDLTPERFEQLGFLVARTESASVVPVRNKDRGLDARLPGPNGTTRRGFQAKRYAAGAIKWAECRSSLRAAAAFWRPPYVTFIFAEDLSAKEQKQLETELADHFPLVRVDHWPGSEVNRRLRDTTQGQRAAAWLFEDDKANLEAMRRAMATGGELNSPLQAAERQAVIQKYMDQDPHIAYTMVSRGPGAPETAPHPSTFLSVVMQFDDQEIRFDATERYPGALDDLGGGPRLSLSDDDAGNAAAKALDDVARDGGTQIIETGVQTDMPQVPLGLRGLLPDDGLTGPVEVSAGPRYEEPDQHAEEKPIPVLVCVADAEIGMQLAALDPPKKGFDISLAGTAGGLELVQSVRGALADSHGPSNWVMDFRHNLGDGTATEQLLAARIVLAGLLGQPIELRGLNDDGSDRPLATLQGVTGDTDNLEHLQSWIGYLELVAELERWLGEPLSPSSPATEEDRSAVARALGLIRNTDVVGTWSSFTLQMREPPPSEIEDGPQTLVSLTPRYDTLFGERHYLGLQMDAFHQANITIDGLEIHGAPANGDETVHVTFTSPAEAPAEAAHDAADGSGARILTRPAPPSDRHADNGA
ncbi:MAG: hypothetical protein WC558_04010 [Patulibacter sp.]